MTSEITPRHSLMGLASLQRESPLSSDDGTPLTIARTHSLLDDMDDSPTHSSSPSKKLRISQYDASNGWQGFCRKGTRIKALLDHAFVSVVSSSGVEGEGARGQESRDSESQAQMSAIDATISPASDPSSIASIARQKTEECIQLQQLLERAMMEQTQLKALNSELREAARLHSARMQKMTNALQLASQNASKARVDADAAEATAATLATQLQGLQTVVDETKRASHVLLKEQDEMTQKAQSIEQRYVHTQAELARASTQRQKLQQQNQMLTQTTKSLEDKIQELKNQLDHQKGETRLWKQSCSELHDTEDSLQQRADRLEAELQQAQTLLVEATATAAETEVTATELKQSMANLQQANQQLHKQLEEHQIEARHETKNHLDALQAARKETQALKDRDMNQQDQIQRLMSDMHAQERRLSQMKTKTANLERRLQQATDLTDTNQSKENTSSFSIPTLGKDGNAFPTCKCTICFKDAVGLMKKCQCGKPGCQSRAHATCVNKITAGPSVSHPGTPAPRLPVVLCGSKTAAITPISSGANVGRL